MAGEGGAAVLQVLVQNLIDLSTNEISLIRGLKKEAQKLTLNLDTIQQFLNDAERRSIPTGAVKSWLQRLENAAFEADNVLDAFNYHLLSRKLNKGKVLLTCFSFFPHIARKRKMAVSIKEINNDLKSINETATELGLQKIVLADAPTVPDAGRETDSFSADPIFIGRDEVVSEIVETLTNSVATHDDERVFSILPIVGMGGLGKTTLTRKVFHHHKMETQFGSRIWVHVSEVFDPINLFNKILKELMTSSQSNKDESRQEILRKLEEALKDKTYLLVLDDVWNEDDSKWEDFLKSLSGVTNTKGNAIIVTTRSMKVASIEGALRIHKLKGLSEEHCWTIIRAKTFGNEDVPLDFESIGKEIAKRCGGLPLAASVVGGVLRCDKSVDKWVSIRDDWLPEGEEEGENNITKILRLSFNNLSSPSLKKCFACCSIFPKGERVWKKHLIEMWMGEGFLGNNEDMESVGDKFYNVLLHSSLLQVDEYRYYEERCVMHDLVHDLASSVSDGVSRVRYLFHKFHKEGESSTIKKEVAQHVRTLIFEADQPFDDNIFAADQPFDDNIFAADQPFDDNIFSDFKSLHVLILKGESLKELPRSIRKLIHLRNLNISETNIIHLPDWIGELHHLQMLRAERVTLLPSTIKNLINLRNLHAGIFAKLPAEIGRLIYLQTTSADFIVQDKNGYKITELGSLNNLKGSLKIRGLEKVHDKEEAEKANLSKKSKLSELRLEWNYNRDEVERINDENVLEGLQPHSNLKKLEIQGFDGKSFPEWTLKMTVRNELFYNNPHLSVLKISRCPKLREIPDGLQTLNSLKELIIEECPDLKRIVCSSGGSLTSLAVLSIRGCHGLMDLPYEMVESLSALELKTVMLEGLSSLSNLPRLIECLAKSAAGLRKLTIVGVPKFIATTVEVWHFPKLYSLDIDVSTEGSGDTSVATLDRILQGCSCDSLRKLYLTGMDSWECLPESIQHLTSLEELELNNFGMEELPEWFDQYISCTNSWFHLKLSECKRLRRLPSTYAMRRLIEKKRVHITGCPELTTTK